MEEMAELVAVLVGETMKGASGGGIFYEKRNVLERQEKRAPARVWVFGTERRKKIYPKGGGPPI